MNRQKFHKIKVKQKPNFFTFLVTQFSGFFCCNPLQFDAIEASGKTWQDLRSYIPRMHYLLPKRDPCVSLHFFTLPFTLRDIYSTPQSNIVLLDLHMLLKTHF